MAKNAQRTNALGMELTPETFGKKEDPVVVKPVVKSKSLTKNISITLQEEAIEKLDRIAKEQDISRSKLINRWIMSI